MRVPGEWACSQGGWRGGAEREGAGAGAGAVGVLPKRLREPNFSPMPERREGTTQASSFLRFIGTCSTIYSVSIQLVREGFGP